LKLRALRKDETLGIIVEMQPEIYDVCAAHELVKLLLDAVNFGSWACCSITYKLFDSLAYRCKIVIIKYIHLIIGQAYS